MDMSRGYYRCFGEGLDTWELFVLGLLLFATIQLGYSALRRRRSPHAAAALRLGSRRRGGGASS